MDLTQTDEEEKNLHEWITVSSRVPKSEKINKQNQNTANPKPQKTGNYHKTIHIVITIPATKISNNDQLR